MEILEIVKVIADLTADLIGLKKTGKKRTQSNHSDANRNIIVSEADMVKRLKILMSIPINSKKYSENLDNVLEQIWNEKVNAFEIEGRRNEFALYSGRMGLVKQYANERNGIRIKIILDDLLGSLEEDKKACLKVLHLHEE